MTKENYANVSNEDDLKWKMTANGRLPKISKVIYLSKTRLDLPQIGNVSSEQKGKQLKHCCLERVLQADCFCYGLLIHLYILILLLPGGMMAGRKKIILVLSLFFFANQPVECMNSFS